MSLNNAINSLQTLSPNSIVNFTSVNTSGNYNGVSFTSFIYVNQILSTLIIPVSPVIAGASSLYISPTYNVAAGNTAAQTDNVYIDGGFLTGGGAVNRACSLTLVAPTYGSVRNLALFTQGNVEFATGTLAIGGLPNALASLIVYSTTSGICFPNMNSTQKNAISNLAGNVVYDADLACLSYNNGSSWTNIQPGTPHFTTKTVNDADYVALTSDFYIGYSNITTTRTVTLPAPASVPGQMFVVKNETSNNLTISVVSASGNVDGGASHNQTLALVAAIYISDGTNYWIIGQARQL